LLLSADVGEGLFFAGPAHVSVRVIASPDEHALITTKPEELLKRQAPKTPAATHEIPITTVSAPVIQTVPITPIPQQKTQ